jgi:hypothetical protein
MFDVLTIRESRSVGIVKYAFRVLVAAYFAIGLTAGYRAYHQIRSFQLNVSDPVVHAGSKLETELVTYARVPITVKLELIQGDHVEELSNEVVRDNEWAFLDPRSLAATQTFVMTTEVLERFQAGSAVLRATAIGRMQLSYTPPPAVREMNIEIQK